MDQNIDPTKVFIPLVPQSELPKANIKCTWNGREITLVHEKQSTKEIFAEKLGKTTTIHVKIEGKLFRLEKQGLNRETILAFKALEKTGSLINHFSKMATQCNIFSAQAEINAKKAHLPKREQEQYKIFHNHAELFMHTIDSKTLLDDSLFKKFEQNFLSDLASTLRDLAEFATLTQADRDCIMSHAQAYLEERRIECKVSARFEEIAPSHNLFTSTAFDEASRPTRKMAPVQLERYQQLIKFKKSEFADLSQLALSDNASFEKFKKNFTENVSEFLGTHPLFASLSKKDKQIVLDHASQCCDETRTIVLARSTVEINKYQNFIESLKKRDVDLKKEIYKLIKYINDNHDIVMKAISPQEAVVLSRGRSSEITGSQQKRVAQPPPGDDYALFVEHEIDKFLSNELEKLGTDADHMKYYFTPDATQHPELNAIVYGAAEHMGFGPLGGNKYAVSLAYMTDVLKKSEPPFPQELIHAFEFATEIETLHESRTVSEDILAENIDKEIKKLQPGQSTILPTGHFGHATALYITCTSINNSGEKIYKVVLYNTSFDPEKSYHYQRINAQGKKEYQLGLIIDTVPASSLTKSTLRSLLKAKGKSPEKPYEILTSLGGTIPPPSKDDRLWSKGQVGESCTISGLIALLKAEEPADVYKNFKDYRRYDMLLKTMKKIDAEDAESMAQKVVALEVAKKLARSTEKRTSETKEAKMAEIHTFRQELAKHIPSTSSKKIFQEIEAYPSSKKPTAETEIAAPQAQPSQVISSEEKALSPEAQAINRAFALITDSLPTDEKRQEAIECMKLALTKIKTEQLSPENINEYIMLSLEISSLLQRTPLTAEQVTLLSALTALVSERLEQCNSSELSLPQKTVVPQFKPFSDYLFTRYTKMKKPEDLQDAPELLTQIEKINPPQLPGQVVISEVMQHMIESVALAKKERI